MSEPEHILRQQGRVIRPPWCNCHNAYWMRNLEDPECHYHSDYGEELRDLIARAADRIYMWVDAGLDPSIETKVLIGELRKAAQ